jgi:hypothetical protein
LSLVTFLNDAIPQPFDTTQGHILPSFTLTLSFQKIQFNVILSSHQFFHQNSAFFWKRNLYSGAHAFISRAKISTMNRVQVIILEKFKQDSQTKTECSIRKANRLSTLHIHLINNYKSMEYCTLSFKQLEQTFILQYSGLFTYTECPRKKDQYFGRS